jgi:hypothetical protein
VDGVAAYLDDDLSGKDFEPSLRVRSMIVPMSLPILPVVVPCRADLTSGWLACSPSETEDGVGTTETLKVRFCRTTDAKMGKIGRK